MDNRTASVLEEIDNFSSRELSAMQTFREAGGKAAAFFCRAFPPALLAGLDLWPLRMARGGTIEAESAGERLIRPDTCPFCRSILGNFLEKKTPHASVDLIVGLITCDQMRRTLERLAADLSMPLFPVQLPATRTPEARRYFIEQVEHALGDIAEYAASELDLRRMRKDAEARYGVASILAGLHDGCRTHPLVLHRLTALSAWCRPTKLGEFIEDLRQRLPVFTPVKRVLITGSTICEEDTTLAVALAERDIGAVVLTCTGLNWLDGFTDLGDVHDNRLVETLCEAAFNLPACMRFRPNHEVYERIGTIARRKQVAGIILKTLPFCDLWFTEKKRMAETFDLPLLILDTGFGEGDEGRTVTRTEAFLESLP